MKRISSLLLLAAALALVAVMQSRPATAAGVQVDPVIWQFDRDYPGAEANDSVLPVHAVYLKTHDGTDWMSTFDTHPRAISGPDAVRSAIQTYGAQGIEVIAWFVPKGTDVEVQVRMAEEVLDTGVKTLYADIEPFRGFCAEDCPFLAGSLWARLRQERPGATLGVIYDPRSPYREWSAASQWLSVANAAAPMCYWETFSGQSPWSSPQLCVEQGYLDLQEMAGGRSIQYVPMLQGDSTPERVLEAMDAAQSLGSSRASVWRRGVVPMAVWQAIAGYVEPAPTPQPSGGRELAWGDIDCRSDVTIADAQKLARSLIDLAIVQFEPCFPVGADVPLGDTTVRWGDIDCNGGLSISDSQKLARALIGLTVEQEVSCPPVGSRIPVPG